MASLESIRSVLAFVALCGMIVVMVYASRKLMYSTVEVYSLEDMWRRLKDLREKLDDTEISQADMRSQADEQKRILTVNSNKANLMLAKLVQVEAEKDKTIAELLNKSDTLHPVVQTLENHSKSKRDAGTEIAADAASKLPESEVSNSELKELFPDFDISNIRYAEGSAFMATGNFGIDENDPNWEEKFRQETRTAVGRGEDFHTNMSAGMQSARSSQEIDMLLKEAQANDARRFGSAEYAARRTTGNRRKKDEAESSVSNLFTPDDAPVLATDQRYSEK